MRSPETDPPHRLELPGGGVLAWHEYGDPAGRPLFFFHGWPSSGRQGVFLDGIGKARGFRIVSPSRPGLAGSSRQPGRSFRDWPPLAARLADSLGIGAFRIMGVSGGGPYALACAWALGRQVEATAVVCGAPPLDTPQARRQFSPVYRAMLLVNDRSPASLEAFLSVAVRLARVPLPFAAFHLMTAALGRRDREVLRDRARFGLFYPAFSGAMRSGGRAVYEDGRCYSLPWEFDPAEIRSPVQFWHGGQDSNFHWSLAEKLAGRIPGAEFHLRTEGHYSLPVFCGEEITERLMAQPGS